MSAEGARLWVPLVDGTERLGVLEVLTDGPDAAAEPQVADHELDDVVSAVVA